MKAYEELYKRMFARLVHFSASIVGSFQLAEEIISDVFVLLWQKRNDLTHVTSPVVYLYVCVKNHSLNALASKKMQHIPFESLDTDALAIKPDIEDRLASKEVCSALEKAVNGLPGRCQLIFRLIKMDGLTYKETAELLDISPKTVDAQLAIAMKKLSQAIRFYTPVLQAKY